MHACTIAARNYLAHARVLAESFREHHPAAGFTVLVVDALAGEELDAGAPYRTVRPADIGMAPEVLAEMATIYDVLELSTALKPTLLRHLVAEHGGTVLYLDPDIEFFAPIHEADGWAAEHDIVLTPHVATPMPRDGLTIDEGALLRSGIFNLGFIGVGPGADPFLAWWQERLRFDACSDVAAGLFTDQRWIDFVPALFDPVVCRDLGWNVAYWNLHERPLTRSGDTVLAGGVPLRFVHLSGVDASRPHLLSKHQGDRPRTLLSEQPVLADLVAAYGRRLDSAGAARFEAMAYRFGSVAGGPLPLEVRRLVRDALLRPGPGEEPPPPAFGPHGPEGLLAWLNQPVARFEGATVTRLVHHVWANRADLQGAFPRALGGDAPALVRWVATDPGFGERLGHLHRPERTRLAPVERSSPGPGLNVIGYLHGELGVGEAGRLAALAAEAAGLPFSTVAHRATWSRQRDPFVSAGPAGCPFDVSLLCANADATPGLVAALPPELLEGRHRVGLWFWEVDEFPAAHLDGFDHVDEVWVTSEFVARTVRRHTAKAVHVFPLPVRQPAPTRLARADLGLPEDRFTFLFAFDAFSVPNRKNPAGALRAYLEAFEPGDGAFLLLKVVNGDSQRAALEELRHLAGTRPDVRILEGYLSRLEVSALTQLADAYVSLHRSEGFGLTMAEAMAAAKPVVATGYSGNLAFMTPTNSLLVPYELVEVGHGSDPYPAHAHWADPDLGAAARAMRALADDPALAADIGRQASRSVQATHGAGRAARWLRGRLDALARSRALAGVG